MEAPLRYRLNNAIRHRLRAALGRIPKAQKAGHGWLFLQWLRKIVTGRPYHWQRNAYASSTHLDRIGAIKRIALRPEQSRGISIPSACHPRIRRTLSELETTPEREVFVAELSGLHLTAFGDCATSEGVVIDDIWLDLAAPTSTRDGIITRMLNRPPRHLSRPSTSLCIPYNNVYAHWLYQAIPRLDILKQAGIDVCDLNVLMPADSREWMVNIAIEYGIKREQMVFTGQEPAKGRLVITGVPQIQPSLRSINYLRAGAEKYFRKQTETKFFIDRPDAYGRRILNGTVLREALVKHGVECINPAILPFCEQVTLFSQAKLIIAVHGSALANIVFCQPGTVVVELFPANHIGSTFYAVAARLGLRHHSIIGTEPPMPAMLDRAFKVEHPGYYNSTIDDIIVPVVALEKLLSNLESSSDEKKVSLGESSAPSPYPWG